MPADSATYNDKESISNSSYAPSWKYDIIGGIKNDLIELYSDYLLSSFGKTTATGVAELLDNAYSHDQFTRLLSTNEFTSRFAMASRQIFRTTN